MIWQAFFVTISMAQGASAPLEPLSTDEIVVTASRTAEIWRDVPASIGRVSEDELKTIAAVHPAEVLNTVAGVNIQRGNGQEHLTAIRSPVLTGGAGAGSFLYLQDGVPIRAAGFANVNGLFESAADFASSIEVTRGPGSVLYGSNAQHGLVNVLTRPVEGGNDVDLKIGDGLASGKASASLGSIRLNISALHDEGFRNDAGVDQQKLLLSHTGKFGGWTARSRFFAQNLNQETAGFVQGDDAYLDEDQSKTNAFPEAFRDGRSYLAMTRLDREIGEGTLSVTPFARSNDLRFLRHFVPGQALEESKHQSLGVLTTWYGAHSKGDYVLGVDVDLTKGSVFEFQENPDRFSFVQGDHYDYSVDATVIGLYGQTDIELTDRFILDLGLRADYTSYKYETDLSPATRGRFKVVPDRQDDFTTLTPRLGLTYNLNDSTTLYGRAARGARAPQVADLFSLQVNQNVAEIDSETLDSFEAGVKTVREGLTLEAVVFSMEKDNFFFRDADGFNVTNGKTSHQGIEASFRANLTPALSLRGAGTWAEHLYEFDRQISGSPSSSISSGDDVDTAPRTIGSMAVRFEPIQGRYLDLEWRHMGDYFTDNGNTQDYPGHDIFVARAGLSLKNGAALYGRIDNLTDERYADRADFAFGNERYFPGRPRTAIVGIRQNW